MDSEEAKRLIAAAGGDAAIARLLGIAGEPYFRQRVANWRTRGIPAKVILEHQDVFKRLKRAAERA